MRLEFFAELPPDIFLSLGHAGFTFKRHGMRGLGPQTPNHVGSGDIPQTRVPLFWLVGPGSEKLSQTGLVAWRAYIGD